MAQVLRPLDARIPGWDPDDLVERSCPFCRSDEAQATYLRPDGLTVHRCARCRAFFVSPAPSEGQLRRFYDHYDESHGREAQVGAAALAASYARIDPFSDLRIRELGSLFEFRGARVLDVGFGRAQFLYAVRKLGAVPFGLELDAEALEIARSLGIGAAREDIASHSAEAGYDLVSLLDLVEHPLEPMDVLRHARELLCPDGLLVLWTPNGEPASGDDQPTQFRVDLEHMQYLTVGTCAWIAVQLDMRVVHLETVGYPALEGIDRPAARTAPPARSLRASIRAFPGVAGLNDARHRLLDRPVDERRGSYHLFCILQKPA